MKLPKRNKTHIKETESDRIFRNLIPSEWIIREVTERDYGIDYYVETVYKQSKNKEFVLSGDLVSIQLKSKNKIKWLKKSSKKSFFRIKRALMGSGLAFCSLNGRVGQPFQGRYKAFLVEKKGEVC